MTCFGFFFAAQHDLAGVHFFLAHGLRFQAVVLGLHLGVGHRVGAGDVFKQSLLQEVVADVFQAIFELGALCPGCDGWLLAG